MRKRKNIWRDSEFYLWPEECGASVVTDKALLVVVSADGGIGEDGFTFCRIARRVYLLVCASAFAFVAALMCI